MYLSTEKQLEKSTNNDIPNQKIQVSICCLVYNHEKYLRQCLDGFVMQKDVAFEVLIHDDASTDHSADIIREYEVKYPGIFKPIYQTENQYSKGVPINTTYQYPRAKGKYIAICEGDDFWTDPYKLKKQVQALEENPDCQCCISRVQGVAEDGVRKGKKYPICRVKTGVLDTATYYSVINKCPFPFQVSGFMINTKSLKEYADNPPEYCRLAPVGDYPLFLYAGTIGDVFFFNETMSCYRRGVPNSWTNSKHTQATKRFLDMIAAFECNMSEKVDLSDAINRMKASNIEAELGAASAYQFLKETKKRSFSLHKQQLKYWIQAYFPQILAIKEKIKHGKK